jgi:hypothetical protein
LVRHRKHGRDARVAFEVFDAQLPAFFRICKKPTNQQGLLVSEVVSLGNNGFPGKELVMPSHLFSPRHAAARPEVVVALGALIVVAASVLPVVHQARVSADRVPAPTPIREIGAALNTPAAPASEAQAGSATRPAHLGQAMMIWVDGERARTPADRAQHDSAIRSFHG